MVGATNNIFLLANKINKLQAYKIAPPVAYKIGPLAKTCTIYSHTSLGF